MPCRAPLEAVGRNGEKPIIYPRGQRPRNLSEGYEALELQCGQCRGCKLEKSRVWGARIAHECAWLWEEYNLPSVFITLTYSEKHLPIGGSLVPKHVQDFIKRLRRRIEPNKIRHYCSGEYGTQCQKHEIHDCVLCGPIQRPHYHGIIMGFGFPDRQPVGQRDGLTVYESELLSQLWEYGFHEIGSASFESAAYCARYVMKKQTGKPVDKGHYTRYDPWMDRWYDVDPEFAIMSTGHTCKKHRGMDYQQDCENCSRGIGTDWAYKYLADMYPRDELPIPGRGSYGIPPKYYDQLYERIHGKAALHEIKQKRRDEFAQSLVDGPSLESRAICQDARIDKLGRTL